MTVLYERDPHEWAQQQASYLRSGQLYKLDLEHLVEEIECLGRREKSSLKSYLEILLMHKLKAKYQQEKQTKSWNLSIHAAEMEVKDILEENPSLKAEIKEVFHKAYKKSRISAALETELEIEKFPQACPWTLKQLLPYLEDKYTGER